MNIVFDGKKIAVEDSTKNIVEIAKEHGVYIPAPCFYKKSEDGCCKGCLILVNGEEAYACETLPVADMEIIYDRDDLAEQRSRNLVRYANRDKIEETVKNCGSGHECGHGHSHEGGCGDDCDCGGSCGCGSH